MEYTIEQIKSTVSAKFTTNEEEWNNAVAAAYQKTKGEYKVPGFRPGKAPRHMIEQMYGPTVFVDDAIDNLINEGYFKFLEENKEIDPIDRPKVEIDSFDGKSVKFTINVSVKPDIKLGAYKGIKLPKIAYNVSQEQIDGEINAAREKSARFVEVERKAKNGDIVNIDYSGSVDGVKFDGGTAEKHDLTLGSNTFIPGFEDQLIGHKKGEDVDVKVKFPDEYHSEELKGKEAVFACKINSVSEKEIPEADDKWASEVSQFETLEAYTADIKDRLVKECERREKTERENAVINAIVDTAECEVPEPLVEAYLEDMLKDIEMRLYYQGLKIEDYFKYTGSSVEQYKKERRDEAVRGALTRLCLEEIIKLENIVVSDEEAEAKYYDSFPKSKEENKVPTTQELGYVKNEIGMDKLLKLLVDSAVWMDEAPKAKKTTAKKTVAEEKLENEKEPARKAKSAATKAKTTKKSDV